MSIQEYTTHYVVDVWIKNSIITEDQLDEALAVAITQLQVAHNTDTSNVDYDLSNMGDDEQDDGDWDEEEIF